MALPCKLWWEIKGNLFHQKILISLENSNSRDVRESVEKLQHCQKTPAIVTIFCQKSSISSEKSNIVGKLWYCPKTLKSSENSDIFGKLRYRQKTLIFMMNISMINGGKFVRHPDSLYLPATFDLYVGIGLRHFYPLVEGTPRYERFKKALPTGFFQFEITCLFQIVSICMQHNLKSIYIGKIEKNMNFLGQTKWFKIVLHANAENLKSPAYI